MPSNPSVDRRGGANSDPNSGLMLYAVGWKDNLTSINAAKVTGANQPSWSQIRDGIYAYEFTSNQLKEVFANFHINHDYAPDTDMFPHVHFVPMTNEIAGVIRWGFEYSLAKRDHDASFPATTTVYIESTVAANSQYSHLVSEVSDADAISGRGNVIEPDTVVMCRFFRDGSHANDTYAGSVGGIFIDLHYQSDRDDTKNRESDFYS